MESEIIHHLDYNHINYAEKNYMQSYLKNKPSDVIMYSEDGTVFKTHKELLFQTEFLREVLKVQNCCDTVEIICPCSKEDLEQMLEFVEHGKVFNFDKSVFSRILDNLESILGYPNFLDVSISVKTPYRKNTCNKIHVT